MKLPDRKETEVRGLLEAGPPEARAARPRGARRAARSSAWRSGAGRVQLVLWVFFAAGVALRRLGRAGRPLVGPAAQTTPPLGW